MVQNEIRALMYCNTSLVKQEGSTTVFEVVETIFRKGGADGKDIPFLVHYNESKCEMKCLCRLFEFRGLVCRHLIYILFRLKVSIVLDKYILNRWRKNVNRDYQGITNIYDDSCHIEEDKRRKNRLQPLWNEVSDLGSKNDENLLIVEEMLKETKQRLMDVNEIHSMEGNESRVAKSLHSPLKVRSRGRPPTKRK
ncbi:protein FAR-RED IMPAIRED RESPONSE 1-like [Impatiens glandulifera]|uniref:protein FAR-RED IMPAIRED RESPONSE 1-like n=1 Tax=Impatiens glandulifera TaxID=253017 RepID=UPI001FB055D8|nr:protein FAR-RED IMPAIRED RESPONSE 1-like [Impatiens glandulifera]